MALSQYYTELWVYASQGWLRFSYGLGLVRTVLGTDFRWLLNRALN